MSEHGAKEYRGDMAAIHDEVVQTGEPALVTRDGRPYVKVVPASEESELQRLADEGAVVIPSARRASIEPIDAGGDDTTSILGDLRR